MKCPQEISRLYLNFMLIQFMLDKTDKGIKLRDLRICQANGL